MDDYVEDYSYNNNFWMKSGVLYSHCNAKFNEFMSIGNIFQKLSELTFDYSENILKAKKAVEKSDNENEKPKDKKRKTVEQEPKSFYIPLDKPDNSTRSAAIEALFNFFDRFAKNLFNLSEAFRRISTGFSDTEVGYKTKTSYEQVCENKSKLYQTALNKSGVKRKSYFDSINKAIEHYLSPKNKGGKNFEKDKADVNKKRKEYKEHLKEVEKIRVDYIDLQGHLFAIMDEFERNCTNDLKRILQSFIKEIEIFQKELYFTESEKKKIEEMSGELDNKMFSEENKSLMTGPKRDLFKEYSQDLHYYMENFDFLKKEAKNKNSKELREFQKNISQEVSKFLNEIIIEEQNEINDKILEISKNLKDSKLKEDEFNYLILKFEERFKRYLKWKANNNAGSQNYRKVGEEYDDRYCYMQTFLGYFNKTRVGNKCLDEINFNYFCKAVEKILELNMNEDIDYSLCDLIVILSSTFYMKDSTKKSGKKYINEVVRNCPIMQKQGFWVGLTKFELNQELQMQKNDESEILKENYISMEKMNNSIIAKLMSVSYNIMQFINDSQLFNKVVCDIFKYCKIDKESRATILQMMEQQIQAESITNIILDKEMILGE